MLQKLLIILKKHKAVTKVIYATEHNEEISRRAKKYLKSGNGALVGIELAGGIEAGKKFIESLKMFYHVANMVMLEV
jgi:O-acetylhomoserine (thiol)-lyase